jgi:hypothetical protein
MNPSIRCIQSNNDNYMLCLQYRDITLGLSRMKLNSEDEINEKNIRVVCLNNLKLQY